jgi:asparagine synthase (glutamine-hydrolysing)
MGNIAGLVSPNIYEDISVVKTMLHGESKIFRHRNAIIGTIGASFQDKNGCLVFDGVIYNLEELSDGNDIKEPAEILLYAYHTWGENFVEKINGSFTIAIVDHKKEKLLLYRDRLGERNLYWTRIHDHFIFSTNIKGALASGLVPQTVSEDGLAAYLTLGYTPQDMTHIKQVNKLLPGYYLELNLIDKKLSILPYWSYSSCFGGWLPDENFSSTLDNLLKSRTPTAPSISMILEDSISSQALHKLIEKHSKVHTITTENYPVTEQNVNDFLVPMIWHLGEPVADPHLISSWNILRQASSQSKNIFTGMGNDILLNSCKRYFIEISSLFQQQEKNKPLWLFYLVGLFNKKAAFSILKSSFNSSYQSHYFSDIAIFDAKILKKASPTLSKLFHMTSFVQKFHNIDRCHKEWLKPLYFDVKTVLPDGILSPRNILSEAHGVTLHNPFLDHRVIELLARIYGHQEWHSDNIPLNDIIKRFFPEINDFVPEKKALPSWIKSELIYELFDLLQNGLLIKTGVIAPKWIKMALQKKEKHLLRLWSLLCLEIWYRLFIYSPIRFDEPYISVKELLK